MKGIVAYFTVGFAASDPRMNGYRANGCVLSISGVLRGYRRRRRLQGRGAFFRLRVRAGISYL